MAAGCYSHALCYESMMPSCTQVVIQFLKGHSHTLDKLLLVFFLSNLSLCGVSHILQSAVREITTVFQHVYGTKRSEQRTGNRTEIITCFKQNSKERLDFSTETSLIHLAGFQLTAISVQALNYLECCNQSASF